MRYSDLPIRRPQQDLLGRSDFALTLARAIDAINVASDGFVIAILGEWGSGKSSVLELMHHYLRHIEMERASQASVPSWKQITPTTIQELEDMWPVFGRIEERIHELELQNKYTTNWERQNRRCMFRYWLGSDSDADIADRYWRLKVHAEQFQRTIVLRFSPWLIAGRAELASALLSELARALGRLFQTEVSDAFGTVLKRLAEFAPIAGAGLDLATQGGAGSLLRAWGDWSNSVASRLTTGKTLDETRQALRGKLSALDQCRVMVIVDDLDRLTPTESLEMVSLIKSLGDLPNVIYVLSYDEKILSELIKKAIRVDGHKFLQKIVQYPVHLPPAETSDLVRMFNVDINELLEPLSPRDTRRLQDAWLYVLRFYLRNPRDVRRFVNAFSVARAGLGDHTDPIDLLMLEALRVFEPDVYAWLRRNMDTVAS